VNANILHKISVPVFRCPIFTMLIKDMTQDPLDVAQRKVFNVGGHQIFPIF